MGVGIKIPGNGPGTGPIIPAPLHSAGVDGYSRRYAAERLADGALTSWASAGSQAVPLAPVGGSGTGGTVTKMTSSGDQFVRLDNSSDAGTIVTGITDGIAPSATPRTLAFVGKFNAMFSGAYTFATYAGANMFTPSAGGSTCTLKGDGSTGLVNAAQSIMGGLYHVFLAVIDPAAPRLRIDGTVQSTVSNAPFTLGALTPLTLKVRSQSGSDWTLDLREIIVWDRALDLTEGAAVRAALKARYTDLP